MSNSSEDIQSVRKRLLDICLKKTNDADNQSTFRPKAHFQLLANKKHQQWLEDQLSLVESRNAVEEDVMVIDEDEDDVREEQLQTKVLDLQEATFNATSTRNAQELFLKRITQHSYALNCVFPELGEDNLLPDEKYIKLLTTHRDEKLSELAEIQKQIAKLKEDIHTCRLESSKISVENRNLFKKLETMKTEAESKDNKPTIQKLEEEVKAHKGRNNIVKNVLQALVLESGVNWVEDPKLYEVFMSENM